MNRKFLLCTVKMLFLLLLDRFRRKHFQIPDHSRHENEADLCKRICSHIMSAPFVVKISFPFQKSSYAVHKTLVFMCKPRLLSEAGGWDAFMSRRAQHYLQISSHIHSAVGINRKRSVICSIRKPGIAEQHRSGDPGLIRTNCAISVSRLLRFMHALRQ